VAGEDLAMNTTVIGIDCATDAKNVGAARAVFDGRNLEVVEAGCGSSESELRRLLCEWASTEGRVLLALDAPLGWPEALGRSLIGHTAGAVIEEAPDKMFRRLTDRVITETCKKRPLDVGADRIARTAHAALRLLGDISGAAHQRVPLAWKAQFEERIAAIEVYPAATLASRGIRCSEYKKKEQRVERREIIAHLSKYLSLSMDVSCLVEDADILDAVVCALAGADFLQEDVLWPKDFQTARHEGWIWSKGPALVPEK
jgi:predicted RNase H-like nuclease